MAQRKGDGVASCGVDCENLTDKLESQNSGRQRELRAFFLFAFCWLSAVSKRAKKKQQTPSNKLGKVAMADRQKMQMLSKIGYEGHNLLINKEAAGVSRALHEAQRMLESQS